MDILEAIKAVTAKPDSIKPETPKAKEFDPQFDMRFVQSKGQYTVPDMGFAASASAENPALNPSTVASCREVFANRFTSETRCIFFNAQTRPRVLSLILFFRILEGKLNLKPENRTRFSHYSSPGVAVITLSPWWVKTNLRRQIFTILLRCGSNFTGDFNAALRSDEYAKGTIYAVERFIEGFTREAKGTNYGNGWMVTFHGKTKAQINALLPPKAE